MKAARKSVQKNGIICCPEFHPERWMNKIWYWNNKKFIRDSVLTFFYMPLNFGMVMRRLNKKVQNSAAEILDGLCLSDHTSKWNMDVFLAVDREISKANNLNLSSRYFSKVYEGSFRDTANWCRDYENAVTSEGMKIKKWYMWYTTCPKCAKKYGKNYVVILSEVE